MALANQSNRAVHANAASCGFPWAITANCRLLQRLACRSPQSQCFFQRKQAITWGSLVKFQSNHRHPAIHMQRLAGDVSGLVAGEVNRRRSDIFRRTHRPGGDFRENRFFLLVG